MTKTGSEGAPTGEAISPLSPTRAALPPALPPSPPAAAPVPGALASPPKGIRQNNPGNIDYEPGTVWVGQILPQPPGERFCFFTSPDYGIRALMKLLQNYQREHGLKTVEELISRWAPSTENNTGAYVADVCDFVNKQCRPTVSWGPGEVLDLETEDLDFLTQAIIHHENGEVPYTPEQFEAAGALLDLHFT